MTKPTIKIDVSIEIPVDLAEDTMRQLTNFVGVIKSIPEASPNMPVADPQQDQIPVYHENSQIAQGLEHMGQKAFQAKQKEEADLAEKAEQRRLRQIEIDQNLALFKLRSAQAYSQYRKIVRDHSKAAHAAKVVGAKWGWSAPVCMSFISKRRKVVKAKVREYHKRRSLSLAVQGWPIEKIAAHLKIGSSTIRTHLKNHKANPSLAKTKREAIKALFYFEKGKHPYNIFSKVGLAKLTVKKLFDKWEGHQSCLTA